MSAPPRQALPHRLRYYGLMCRSRSLPLPTVFALVNGSVQVAVSPCWDEDLPDVISVNLSPDAWTPTPVVVTVHLLVTSHDASAFPTLEQVG